MPLPENLRRPMQSGYTGFKVKSRHLLAIKTASKRVVKQRRQKSALVKMKEALRQLREGFFIVKRYSFSAGTPGRSDQLKSAEEVRNLESGGFRRI